MKAMPRTPWDSPAAGLLLASALLLGACSDGYPTEDVSQIEPSGMTQAQLLQALNALGAEPQLDKRWRYELEEGCELRVEVRDGSPPERRLSLEGATFGQRSQDGLTEVLLAPRAADESASIVVLETRRWTDAVRIRSLLTHLKLSCTRPAAPGT